jgi:hypothetical protein
MGPGQSGQRRLQYFVGMVSPHLAQAPDERATNEEDVPDNEVTDIEVVAQEVTTRGAGRPLHGRGDRPDAVLSCSDHERRDVGGV